MRSVAPYETDELVGKAMSTKNTMHVESAALPFANSGSWKRKDETLLAFH